MDTEYILGCSLELAETTALEYTVLSSRLGAYSHIRALVDSNADLPEHYLQNTARTCIERLDPVIRDALALKSLGCLEFSLRAYGEWLEHYVQVKTQGDLGQAEFPTGRLALAAPLPKRQLVRTEADINENVIRELLDELGQPMRQRLERDLQLCSSAISRLALDGGRSLVAHLREDAMAQGAVGLSEVAVRALRARQRREAAESRSKLSRAKAAVKKATRLFENLGQRSNLQLFVSGQEVELAHPASPFKFILRPLRTSGWLLDRTQEGRSHTPYELSLLTKDEVFLANLCVYFDKTPVLDQLLALSLFIQSGDEIKVLEKANWFGLQDWSTEKSSVVLQAYPQLQSKLPRSREADAAVPDDEYRVRPVLEREMTLWRPYQAPVRQWIRTWCEPLTRAAAPLLAAAPEATQLLSQALDPLRVSVQEMRQHVLVHA